MQRHDIDPRRIYVGGISAGAAMALLVARLYPDVFAAVGAFAGIAPGAAMGPLGALSAMRHGGRGLPPWRMGDIRPVIVFQGNDDKVVNPNNASYIMAANVPPGMEQQVSTLQVGGREITRTRYVTPRNKVQAESWLVHGLGHAWCGGTRGGSYTDVLGPNASREMLRFFAEHAQLAAAKSQTGASQQPALEVI